MNLIHKCLNSNVDIFPVRILVEELLSLSNRITAETSRKEDFETGGSESIGFTWISIQTLVPVSSAIFHISADSCREHAAGKSNIVTATRFFNELKLS